MLDRLTRRTTRSVEGLLVTVCDGQGRDRLLYNLGGAAASPFTGTAWTRVRAALQAPGSLRPPVHTSLGHPRESEVFCRELASTLPWAEARSGLPEASDWCVSLQLEGASAVNAACQLLRAKASCRDGRRQLVAVAPQSYHGPRDSAPGSTTSAAEPSHGRAPTPWEVCYPLPMDNESWLMTVGRFEHWASRNASSCAAVLFEPQWGSSRCGAAWDPRALRECIALSQKYGAHAICDEVMCGLGRHGRGTVFLSTAWKLQPDVIVFGKGMAAGGHPFAGAIFRSDPTRRLPDNLAIHCHTYSGASADALRAATSTLRLLPSLYPNIIARGAQCERVLRDSCGDHLTVRGQGLLWGAEWPTDICSEELRRRQQSLMAACDSARVWPYFVKRGFLITPPLDAGGEQLTEALARLSHALSHVLASPTND